MLPISQALRKTTDLEGRAAGLYAEADEARRNLAKARESLDPAYALLNVGEVVVDAEDNETGLAKLDAGRIIRVTLIDSADFQARIDREYAFAVEGHNARMMAHLAPLATPAPAPLAEALS